MDEWHGLRTRILMDAGELGSRHMSVTWLEVPAGAARTLHSHEESEQVYVVVQGSGKMSVAGDTETLGQGDLVMVPPATDHAIENDGSETLACVSVQSPAVSVDELHSRQMATEVAGFDDEDA